MREKRVAVLVLVFLGGFVSALAVSAVAGYFVVLFFIHGYNLSVAVEAQQKVYALKEIKEGNLAKAVERLELGLDGGLMTIGKDNPITKTDETAAKAIALAREYRARYPRKTSSPAVDRAVEEVLSEK